MAGWSVPGVVHLQEVREDPVGRRVLARHRITRKSLGITYLSSEFFADTEFRTRFSREFPRLARVRNGAVTRAHRYVESHHGAALVSDHVSGSPLRAVLRAHGAVGTEAALVVLKGSLRALAACHQAGLSHGDIKPENVILTHAGRVRLVDFGLWTSDGRRLLERSTPFYLAPEQWSGHAAAPAGDVYAATVTFFECLAGAPPFYANGAPELLVKHRNGTPLIDVIPESVRELVRSGLAKDARCRPDTWSLLAQVDDVAAQAVGSGWESRGQRQLTALLASRSAVSDMSALGFHSAAGRERRNPVRLAAVMGGALMLAVGLASPPLAVISPGGTLFGSEGRSPVLAFPEPARETPVRVVTNGPLAGRAPTPAVQAGTAGPVAGARPPASANPALDTHNAPAMPGLRHKGSQNAQDRPASGQPESGQPASPKCTQELVFSIDKPCKAVHPEQPTPGSTGTTPNTTPLVPVSMPLPVQLPAPVQIPTPVQIPAPVHAPRSIPIQDKIGLRQDSPSPKSSLRGWDNEVHTPRRGTTATMDQQRTKRSNSEWGNSRSGDDGPGRAESDSAGSR